VLIDKSGLPRTTLKGKTVLLTGGGGGIGFKAARAFCWLGAHTIIAECDAGKGEAVCLAIDDEIGAGFADYYPIDISDDEQIKALHDYAIKKYGFIDVVFHNATTTPMGAVDAVSMDDWDKSYAVNFRAPLLLTRMFLPAMKERRSGVIVFVASSGAAPYMGAYEVFKTAQVELCNTLAGELENSGVYTYAIGPGLVKTDTAAKAIEIVAGMMEMTIDAFYEMNGKYILSAEEAGTGFALSVVNAERYNGLEISSIQALIDAGLYDDFKEDEEKRQDADWNVLAPAVKSAVATFREQYDGWKNRNVFERQWVLRDFKKTMGVSAEQFESRIDQIESAAESRNYEFLSGCKKDLIKLEEYYQHQFQLLQGYEKNPGKLKEHSEAISEWIETVRDIVNIL
jgi:NAD(P)-dependent dehydrogenase (short-subunit alcohol dehydrogenase family)